MENPVPPYAIDPAWRKVLDAVDVDALRSEFERRLAEQKERHDGGDRWIGTGGTSPFGHSGTHPGGIRVGGEHGAGSAVQVAAERRFQEHRKDLVLDTRQLSVALKKLRALERVGPADELDLSDTIDRTARFGGELELVFKPPRENRLGLVLAMDIGGSMWPFKHLVDTLFSAAHQARHFKRFDHVYFPQHHLRTGLRQREVLRKDSARRSLPPIRPLDETRAGGRCLHVSGRAHRPLRGDRLTPSATSGPVWNTWSGFATTSSTALG